jgi:hypothetical protein
VFAEKYSTQEIVTLIKSKNYLKIENIEMCNKKDLKQIQQVFSNLTNINLKNMTYDETCRIVKEYLYNLKNNQLQVLPQCKTETTLLGADIKDIHPLYFYILNENNNLFCGDIRELVKLKKNPWTNNPFNNTLKNQMQTDLQKLNGIVLDDIEEEIIEAIEITIRKAMLTILEQLRYPKSVEAFVESNNEQTNNFIDKLRDEDILTLSEMYQLRNINDLNSRKLLLAQILKVKLFNDQTVNINGVNIGSISVMLEEIYNNVY